MVTEDRVEDGVVVERKAVSACKCPCNCGRVPVNSYGDTVAGDGFTRVRYTLEEMVNIFCKNGVKCEESTDGGDGRSPSIYFGGGWAAVEQAAKIAKNYEFPVRAVGLMWIPYRAGGLIDWEMQLYGSGIRRN